MSENLKGIPISSLPKADELEADDQLIAYRSDDGKAYRANVGSLGEAAESNISDAFSTFRTYSAGDYCIYNDTLYKFTADKDAGDWDESVVEKTNVGAEVSELNTSISDLIKMQVTDSISITIDAGSTFNDTIDVTVDGYNLLGIVGYQVNHGQCVIFRCYRNNDTSLYYSVRNTSSSSVSTVVQFRCLYIKA